MKRIFLGVLLLLIGAALPVQASFDKAMEAYSAGNYAEAYRSFDALAAIGDYSAAFNIGVMYYRGEYVDRDPVEAWAWMQLVASQSGAEDISLTASKIFSKLAPEEQDDARARLETLLHSHGKQKIYEDLSPTLLSDDECNVERIPVHKESPRYPRVELERGRFGRVVLEYSVMPGGHVRDVTVSQSSAPTFSRAAARSALSYRYEPAAVTEPTSGYKTAVTFNIAGPVDNKRKLVAELNEWKDKAESGDPVAQYVYAFRLGVFRSFRNYMKGVDLEYQTANKWYLEAAKRGVPQAQFEIGRNMVVGRGCEADAQNGMKWISAAAVAGLPEAQSYLATNAGTIPYEERREHAIRWLKNASMNGHYFSGLLLAWELVTGPGQPSAEDLLLAKDLAAEEPVEYFDNVRILETKAAVAAAQADFKTAQRLQKKAIKLARRLEWDLRDANHRYETYKRREKWVGPYYYDILLDPT
ncbi:MULTISPECIES: TonB family protein [unclassified Microbulbifer]|uniref:TonB family protein n=1 Tax=unclassified Microbulbifer TaxID=2619833 RepID=UPI0027E48221|nr:MULTISPECIES: TonB family protein [unclassified Microbulbifer]